MEKHMENGLRPTDFRGLRDSFLSIGGRKLNVIDGRRRIAIMDWDDQFRVAERVVDVLASFNIELDEGQVDILIDEVMDVTEPFSVGLANYELDEDGDIDEA